MCEAVCPTSDMDNHVVPELEKINPSEKEISDKDHVYQQRSPFRRQVCCECSV